MSCEILSSILAFLTAQNPQEVWKNHHHLFRITTLFITDCSILQVTWPLMSNQKLKQQNKTICFSFWLVKSGHVTCRMPQSVIKKVVILNKWWWFFSNFLRVLSSQEGQYWAQNFTGHLLITYSNGFSCRKLSKKNLKWSTLVVRAELIRASWENFLNVIKLIKFSNISARLFLWLWDADGDGIEIYQLMQRGRQQGWQRLLPAWKIWLLIRPRLGRASDWLESCLPLPADRPTPALQATLSRYSVAQ